MELGSTVRGLSSYVECGKFMLITVRPWCLIPRDLLLYASALEVLFVDCAGAYYQPQPVGTTVIVNTDPMMGATLFPPDPMQMTCPNCHQSILTRTQYELGMLVWLVAAMLCIVGYVVCRLRSYNNTVLCMLSVISSRILIV